MKELNKEHADSEEIIKDNSEKKKEYSLKEQTTGKEANAEKPIESEKVQLTKEPDYFEQLQRLQAEFNNYRKRADVEKQKIFMNANEDLIFQLLSVLDNFELSLKHNGDKGIALIYSELYGILERQGLKLIETQGKFDPTFHEVLMTEEGEEDGVILEEISKGYTLNDKVIRVAKVKVSKSLSHKGCRSPCNNPANQM